MRPFPIVGLAALGLALSLAPTSPAAGASVEVDYARPEGFTNARLFAGFGRRADPFVARDLRRHLERLGARYLRDGETLRIEILDIDLAGQFQPAGRDGQGLRVLTEATWPRIKLRYALARDGAPDTPAGAAAEAEEYVSDPAYLRRLGGGHRSDPLFYEKRLLTDWFQKRFAGR